MSTIELFINLINLCAESWHEPDQHFLRVYSLTLTTQQSSSYLSYLQHPSFTAGLFPAHNTGSRDVHGYTFSTSHSIHFCACDNNSFRTLLGEHCPHLSLTEATKQKWSDISYGIVTLPEIPAN